MGLTPIVYAVSNILTSSEHTFKLMTDQELLDSLTCTGLVQYVQYDNNRKGGMIKKYI